MAGKTNYLEGALLNHIFRTTGLSQPTNVYVALFTAAPSDAGGGTEVSGNAYARVAIARADAQWNAPAGTPRAITNVNAVNFPTPTPSGWGTVTHFGIFDASSGGNLLYWAALTQSKTINASDTVSFAAGALSVSED